MLDLNILKRLYTCLVILMEVDGVEPVEEAWIRELMKYLWSEGLEKSDFNAAGEHLGTYLKHLEDELPHDLQAKEILFGIYVNELTHLLDKTAIRFLGFILEKLIFADGRISAEEQDLYAKRFLVNLLRKR